MSYTFALVGNPNCGKTTLFNDITGSTQYVGNWPGVTVEKKEGKARQFKKDDVKIVDLPGIYSLSPYTMEEIIARDYIVNERPDAVINIVDASNIERNLYLTVQLKELGVPVIVALNMMDIVRSRGDSININKLEKELGLPIIPIIARKGEGSKEVVQKALIVSSMKTGEKDEKKSLEFYNKEILTNIDKVKDAFQNNGDLKELNRQWAALKFIEGDSHIEETIELNSSVKAQVASCKEFIEEKFDDDIEGIIADQRYQYITKIVKDCVKKNNRDKLTTSDKIDRLVTNKVLAIPIFLLIMWGVYYVSIQTIGDYSIGWVETLMGYLANGVTNGLTALGAADWIISLVVDGAIGGVGAVFGFVPQIMILFFFISLLEDSGYMARIAFVMDKIFRRFGLSGKSFIPMLIGSGCSVPAIMATRTLENDRDRKLTIILTPFISCGAKLPVYTLFALAFFPRNSANVVFTLYVIGIVVAILSGILLKKLVFKGEAVPFVMELPPYRIPTLKGVLIHMWDRGKGFIKKAGTIIFAASVFIWFLQSFNAQFQMVDAEYSILASIGRFIAPIFAPLGFGDWMSAVSIFTGFVAKEVVVSTMGILHGLGEVAEDNAQLIQSIQNMFTPLQAWSFMIFVLLASPCMAAVAAMKRELNSWKWTISAILYQTGTAYIVSLLVYQIGSLIIK